MADEIMEIETNEQDYITAIKELKENTVSRDAYTKLRNENKKLIESLAEGRTLEGQQTVEVKPDVDQLTRDLYEKGSGLNLLDYTILSLAQREARIEAGGPDPYLPIGKKIAPDALDLEECQKTAEYLQYCVDTSNGDPVAFTTALVSNLKDPPIIAARNRMVK